MRAQPKEIAAGAIFIVFGLTYGLIAWRRLPIGEALNMGPGYFPILLSCILVVLGAAIALRTVSAGENAPLGVIPWRGIVMLTLATVFFAAFVDQVGMLPGIFVTTLLAYHASPKARLVRGIAISIALALFCTALFGFGVRLPLPVLGPWFTF
ncbi:MAG: tripartite tricarboxylate transporter TctB family protein [Rhizobiaceae bacterium]|nr:tripartite tricarboxylate transporter TctB family protein [Rhizobiaceae bacterium]